MSASLTSLARAFKSPAVPVPEAPALSSPETWQDPGLLLIGDKRYGFRCYPGGEHSGCTRVVRLFTDNGFSGDSYDVSFRDSRWRCGCHFFDVNGICSHVMAIQKLMGPMLPAEARYWPVSSPVGVNGH